MIEFILNNQSIRTSAKAGITLLDFVRDHQQLKGTKIGCREGDCGACTVLMGTSMGDAVEYQNITSCIYPLGNAHGKHIVTVEGINLPEKLNAVQNAMVDNYATQCGFCTPGFVVSMTGFALKSRKSDQSCNDAISGNICRCTGYKSIEKAGFSIEEKLTQKDDQPHMQWLITEGFIPDYFETIPQRLKDLRAAIDTNSIAGKGTKVANGTDLYVRHADRMAEEDVHLLAEISELNGIQFSQGICTLGVNTTVTEILENPKLRTVFPRLKQFMKLVSSEPIRNMGTLGGNFVNASPIGDMSIFFLGLDSTLIISDEKGASRELPFHSFHKGYKTYDLQDGEILKTISFRMPERDEHFNFEKVCKRTHLDIASVNSAAKIAVKNDVITDAHISVGGVAAIPKYLYMTSEFLVGKPLEMKTVTEAAKILLSEISPISDVRGTAAYKSVLARQLFFAHFIELFPHHIQFNKRMTQ